MLILSQLNAPHPCTRSSLSNLTSRTLPVMQGLLFPGTAAFLSGKRFCIDGAALIFQPADGGEAVIGEGVAKVPELPSWLQSPKVGNGNGAPLAY